MKPLRNTARTKVIGPFVMEMIFEGFLPNMGKL